MELKRVMAFTHIMRTGSLTRAEIEFGMPKSTLSRLLRTLEDDLGVQLVLRSERKIVPTAEGRLLHAHCEALLSEFSGRCEQARRDVWAMANGSKGRLRILCDNHFTTTFACHVIRTFAGSHPDVLCELDVAGRSDAPRVDDVDCYVCSEPPQLPDVVAKLVGSLSYSLYASPGYLWAHGEPRVPADLAGHTSVALRMPDAPGLPALQSGDAVHQHSSEIAVITNDYWVMKAACFDGLGIALLPDFFVRPEVERGSLVPVLTRWRLPRRLLFCAYRRQNYVAGTLQEFIDLLRRSLEDIEMGIAI